MDASSLSSPSSSSGSLASMDGLEADPLCRWRGTYRPPARFFFEDVSDDEPHHFLDTCFLCKKPLVGNGDIFMYRGDTPFCSEACREEQIEIDEAREKNLKISVKKEQQQQQQKKKKSSTSPKSERIHVPAGAVVAG